MYQHDCQNVKSIRIHKGECSYYDQLDSNTVQCLNFDDNSGGQPYYPKIQVIIESFKS
jgi:hypothetical protein